MDVTNVETEVALVEGQDWYWLEAGGRWVGPVVCAEFLPQMKFNEAWLVQSGFSAPHSGEYMRHVAEISLNGVFLEGRAACLQDSQLDPLREYLEVWYRVRNNVEIGAK